mmetsp:Transcript_754/g.1329  ORF Transcript_754/g.1329 Transcript_754/m.1329 type:complete len:280 (-) Transcript_754:208-1047(-)
MLLKSHAVSFLLGVLAVGGELPVAGPAVAAQVLAVAVEVPREHGLDRVAVQEDEAEVVHLVFWDFNHFLLVVQVTVHELDIPPVLALFDRYSPEAGVLERRVQFAEGGLGVVHVPDVVHQPRRAHRDQAAEHLAPAAPVGGNDVGPALLCIAEGPLPPFLPGSLQLVPGGLPVGGGGCPALEHGQAAAAAAAQLRALAPRGARRVPAGQRAPGFGEPRRAGGGGHAAALAARGEAALRAGRPRVEGVVLAPAAGGPGRGATPRVHRGVHRPRPPHVRAA